MSWSIVTVRLLGFGGVGRKRAIDVMPEPVNVKLLQVVLASMMMPSFVPVTEPNVPLLRTKAVTGCVPPPTRKVCKFVLVDAVPAEISDPPLSITKLLMVFSASSVTVWPALMVTMVVPGLVPNACKTHEAEEATYFSQMEVVLAVAPVEALFQ